MNNTAQHEPDLTNGVPVHDQTGLETFLNQDIPSLDFVPLKPSGFDARCPSKRHTLKVKKEEEDNDLF
jgi:hypothetical protein